MTAVAAAPVHADCPRCGTRFPGGAADAPSNADVECPACSREFHVETFPAYFRERERSGKAESLHTQDEASCFFHPSSRAAAACERCGRFVCGLCDMELDGRHFCPSCLANVAQPELQEKLADQHVLYDNIALFIAAAPLVTCWMTILSAPLTLAVIALWWRRPLSIVPRSRGRYMAAAGIALAELAGWGFYLFAVFHIR